MFIFNSFRKIKKIQWCYKAIPCSLVIWLWFEIFKFPFEHNATCFQIQQLYFFLVFSLDVDECDFPRDICRNGTCINTDGSYECDCYNGFERSENGDCQGMMLCLTQFNRSNIRLQHGWVLSRKTGFYWDCGKNWK